MSGTSDDKSLIGVAERVTRGRVGPLMRPPEYPLKEVYTSGVLCRLRSVSNPGKALLYRLHVIEACGPYPTDAEKAHELMYLRAQKAAWHAYLYTAFACSLFEGDRGSDLRGRLTSTDDDNFRSAMTECMACWFLAGKLKLPVCHSAPGRGGHELDLGVDLPEGVTGVEIKAPYRELPQGAWHGDDSDTLQQCIDTANKQFSDDCPNILFLVPYLRNRSLLEWRLPLIKAFYGQEKITIPIDMRTGAPAGPMENRFFPDGKFLSRERPGGGLLKPDGSPAFTRISAVACVQERCIEVPSGRRVWHEGFGRHFGLVESVYIEHDCLVMHNPHAQHRISPDLWCDCVQFMEANGAMRWNDGRELYGQEVDDADTGGDW